MKKVILCLLILIIAGVAGAHLSVCADEPKLNNECVKFYPSESASGNAYYISENPLSYRLQITNPETENYSVLLTYVIDDESNKTVWSESKSFQLNAESTVIKSFKIPNELGAGIYNVSVTLKGDFGTIKKSTHCSLSVKNDKGSDDMGICTHFGQYIDIAEQGMPQIINSGFGWVRDEIRWEIVEKTAGKYEIPEYYENFVNRAVKSGSKVVLILAYGNPLYDNGGLPTSKEGIKAYAEYCAFMAEHFKGRVSAYEIWNEADLPVFTGGYATNGKQYAEVLKAAYNAVSSYAPVIGGTLTSLTYDSAERYLGEILSNGGGSYMDILGIHPYENDGYYADENAYTENFKIAKRLLNDYDCGDKPIWITEFGSSSNTAPTGYTEKAQAINLVRASVIAKAEPSVEKMFLYNYREYGTEADKLNYHFGIVDYYYNAKPAYLSVSFMNKALNGMNFEKRYGDGLFSIYHFKNNFRDTAALWKNTLVSPSPKLIVANDKADGEGMEITVSEDGRTATVHKNHGDLLELFDMYGNPVEISEEISISDTPVYAVCTRKRDVNIKLDNTDGRISVTGQNAVPDSQITILVRRENSINNQIHYIRQTTANKDGEFVFGFDINKNDVYTIGIYDGSVKTESNIGNTYYNINMEYLVNGKAPERLEDLKNNDVIRGAAEIVRKGEQENNLMFICAVYGEKLISVNAQEVKWNGAEGAALAEIKLDCADDIKDVKFFLWDDLMKPVIRTSEFE